MAAAQTFQQLCQTVNQFLRAGNNVAFGSVATPVNQLQTDIIYFVNQAWQQLQNDHPSWLWMRDRMNGFALTATQRTYTLANLQTGRANYRNFLPMNAANYRYCLMADSNPPIGTQPTQMPVYFIPYQEWRGYWDRTPRPTGQPVRLTEFPDFSLQLDPTPNNAPSGSPWALYFDYRTTNTVLAADADKPNMPADYHDILVWWAIDLYCRTRSNSSPLAAEAKAEVKRQRDRLAAYQLPEITLGRFA